MWRGPDFLTWEPRHQIRIRRTCFISFNAQKATKSVNLGYRYLKLVQISFSTSAVFFMCLCIEESFVQQKYFSPLKKQIRGMALCCKNELKKRAPSERKWENSCVQSKWVGFADTICM